MSQVLAAGSMALILSLAAPAVVQGQVILQPGDMLLVNGAGGMSEPIRFAEQLRFGPSPNGHPIYSHAALYVGANTVAEVLGSGFVLRSVFDSIHDHNYIVDVYRWRGITALQQQAVAALGRNYGGVQIGPPANRYATEQAVFLADATVERDPATLRNKASLVDLSAGGRKLFICSEYVAWAYSLSGLRARVTPWPDLVAAGVISNLDRQMDYTTPNMLARSPDFEFVGTLFSRTPAAGDPAAFTTSLDSTAHVIYRSKDVGFAGLEGHIQTFSLMKGQSWTSEDLTALSGAPLAIGDPAGYMTPTDATARVVYTGTDSHVHELYRLPGGRWTHADLTVLAGATMAAGKPYGYVTRDGTARVLYRGFTGAICELYLQPGGRWTLADITMLAGASAPAAGDPSAYVARDGTARIVYKDFFGAVHELYLEPGGRWKHADLTMLTGSLPAAGKPFGYTTPDGTSRVVYRGVFGHLHELYLDPGSVWKHADLTMLSGAESPAGDPFGYVTLFDGTARVLYRGSSGAVHELYLQPGGSWTHADLTSLAGTPAARGNIFAYVTAFDNTARVVYTRMDGLIQEIYLQAGGHWAGSILQP